MNSAELFQLIADVDEQKIADAAAALNKKRKFWVKWCALAACLCIVMGIGLFSIGILNGGSPFGNGNDTLLDVHRDEFSPYIESGIIKQLGGNSEVKKAYVMLTNEWFLSDALTDFSQVLTTETIYVLPLDDMAYSFYKADEEGRVQESGTAYPPEYAEAPFGFGGLTYEIIENALWEVEYEDYIIAYSPHINTVFIWVRCETEDVFITYPTRPDLLGLEVGGIYSLQEIQAALTNAYNS